MGKGTSNFVGQQVTYLLAFISLVEPGLLMEGEALVDMMQYIELCLWGVWLRDNLTTSSGTCDFTLKIQPFLVFSNLGYVVASSCIHFSVDVAGQVKTVIMPS